MLSGFDKIVEERILAAQRRGDFENLEGSGKPIQLDDANVPEELRLAYKILKNADMVPPEVELRKEIVRTEDLLQGVRDTAEKYRILKKLNFMIMKVNLMRMGSIEMDLPQHYTQKLVRHLEHATESKTYR